MLFRAFVLLTLWPLDRGLALLAWASVLFYRRWISPYKGFQCAHGALTQQPSCSEVGLNAFRKTTFSRAIPIIWAQFARCRSTYGKYRSDLITDANAHLARFSTLATTGVVIGCCPGCPDPGPGPLHNPAAASTTVNKRGDAPAQLPYGIDRWEKVDNEVSWMIEACKVMGRAGAQYGG